jgi:hypothetical protein
MARYITVRVIKVGGSLYFRLPREFTRANNLKAGDMLMPDLNSFRIVRQEDVEALPGEQVVEAVPAE